MSVFGALLRRDLGQMLGGAGRGATLLPVLFFIAVAMLFPFAVGGSCVLLSHRVQPAEYFELLERYAATRRELLRGLERIRPALEEDRPTDRALLRPAHAGPRDRRTGVQDAPLAQRAAVSRLKGRKAGCHRARAPSHTR